MLALADESIEDSAYFELKRFDFSSVGGLIKRGEERG
jgi:hypothetical protein